MLNSPVRWTTAGFETTEMGAEIREGWARVRVKGRTSTVLKQVLEELPWSIRLDSTGNENFGPQEIVIDPVCFGVQYDNCMFSADEAFTTHRFNAKLLCKSGLSFSYTSYYLLSAPGRANMIAAYGYSEGSGGASTDLTLTLADNRSPSGLSAPPPPCALAG